jgi:hypothetical protein
MAYNAGATAAAAEARRRMMEEDEQMTNYSDDELQNYWEFKIVRDNRAVFRNSNQLKKLVEEEKRAGWILLEKLDNSRVRFKRRRSAQVNDEQLISNGIDPYRTYYGMSPDVFNVLVIVFVLTISLFLLGIILLPRIISSF